MAYKFGPNEQCLKRCRRITPLLLAEGDKVVDKGVTVAVRDMPMMPMLMGWWQFTNRTAKAVVRLYDDGFSVEAAPLMRNLIGHAYAMNWLVDNGWPALRAIRAYSDEHRTKLATNVNNTWNLPDLVQVETATLAFEDEADERLHNKLLGELKNFDNLAKAYGTPEIYPVYRHHSALSHTTAYTADAFVVEKDDKLYFATEPQGADLIVERLWIPVALLQAANAISPYIEGHPMKKTIEKAMNDLGLPGEILNLKRGAVPTSFQ
ncbi:DUF5677 domain-containing protein [Streptomyces sp. NBC_00649]|uniref:DUF5677 domain-containing protein n=1 Tax=Streptomyces sp. NBC_00649 TaxID=2975798 RepID=UPI003252CAB3